MSPQNFLKCWKLFYTLIATKDCFIKEKLDSWKKLKFRQSAAKII
nr:MAG TPA: hypothetical protein [Caudoviricetes sp.]